MRIALLETAPDDAPGSMLRYANLLEHTFVRHTEVQITRVRLAPQLRTLKRFPARLRTWGHHAVISARVWALRKSDFDLFHVLDGSHGYVTRWLPTERTVVTSHDVIPWLQGQGHFDVPAPGRAAQWLIQRGLEGLNRARLVLADSECTARDLRSTNCVHSEIEVCPLALEPEFMVPASPRVRAEHELPMIFHVGNNGFYKNRAGVLEVFAKVRAQVPVRLVLAGPAPNAALKERVQQLQLTGDVTFLIDPTDAALQSLYRQAAVFLFPSYYEGFGWPPLEAMASGCPVVASDAGSLPEATGTAALTAGPLEIDQLAQHCLNILGNDAVAAQLKQAGAARAALFSLERLRNQMLAAYQRVLASCGTAQA